MKKIIITLALLAISSVCFAGYLGQIGGNGFGQRYRPRPYGHANLYDSHGVYHGDLNGSQFDPNSVNNPYGRYGSEFSPDSINNPYGAGNQFDEDSPNNPYGEGMSVYGY